jgi:hypothetical protein
MPALPLHCKGKWNHIMDFCEEVMIFENDGSKAMYFEMMNHAESILVEIFGAEYVTKQEMNWLVAIIGRRVEWREKRNYRMVIQPDKELVANSTDGW